VKTLLKIEELSSGAVLMELIDDQTGEAVAVSSYTIESLFRVPRFRTHVDGGSTGRSRRAFL